MRSNRIENANRILYKVEQLLKHIYHRLAKEESSILFLGLKNGKIGLALFFALYSYRLGHNYSRKLSIKILYYVFSHHFLLPCSILFGKMGFSWSLSLLYQKSILEKDEIIEKFLSSVMSEYMHRYYFALTQVTWRTICSLEEFICCSSTVLIIYWKDVL